VFLRRLHHRIPNTEKKMDFVLDAEDKHAKLGDDYESESWDSDPTMPAIERVTSCDSSSTASSNMTTLRLPSLKLETSELVQRVIADDEILDALEEFSDDEISPVSSCDRHQYFSKENLDILLAPEFLEEYNDWVGQTELHKQKEKQMRKRLIQRELDSLLEAARDDLESDGHELEPEAVEALGIAANQVSYVKKYYDVASCQYIYVPSVAHTVMNGSLLDEASKHYFGAKEEFLVAYAGSLGTTILANHQFNDLGLHPKEDIQDDMSTVAPLLPTQGLNEQFWAVSPTAASPSVSPFQSPVQVTAGLTSRSELKQKNVWAPIMGIFLAVMLSHNPFWTSISLDHTINARAPEIFSASRLSLDFFFLYTSEELTTTLPKNNCMEMIDDDSSATVITPRQVPRNTHVRPMLPNLLYY
jgi:hypothetical protein